MYLIMPGYVQLSARLKRTRQRRIQYTLPDIYLERPTRYNPLLQHYIPVTYVLPPQVKCKLRTGSSINSLLLETSQRSRLISLRRL